ncbi:transcriptional regulator, MerR family [Cellulomonas flavigena DSM 20109]|uniref:Transcriptional regulator, MerR family n=1 Tax=Cellulomonas flavigena (strain ATCC 482 / DSM 20109 / BCRC 11376 / JCM 18109 / NBRC 3775 / NCIMB 8073 / NRS 134) TaxID=446466 RepID=D5UH60_CELFN|nr:transcriptional regulator, MerR family [Cellulomonas flavigena DSM 20109]
MSRRMLRHWEQLGLIEPASVDPATGYRRYADSQAGRVRAVASLRAVGSGLEQIVDLLGPGLTQGRLVELLRERAQELERTITEESARLVEVRSRLAALERGSGTVMSTLELGPLPALRLRAVSVAVRDETEIPDAVRDVSTRLRACLSPADRDAEVVCLYDGTSDESITVTAGTAATADAGALGVVEVPAVAAGVSVTFEQSPGSVADAWITLDAALAERGLRTTGVHRHVTATAGPVTLQAPVRTA